MDKRSLLLSTFGLAVVSSALKAGAQGIEIPKPTELIDVLQDDNKYQAMRTGIWILREVLILHDDQTKWATDLEKFQGLVTRVEQSRKDIVAVIDKYKDDIKLTDQVSGSFAKLIGILPDIGIIPTSVLAVQLVRSYVQYNQALATLSSDPDTGSFCGCYPIHPILC